MTKMNQKCSNVHHGAVVVVAVVVVVYGVVPEFVFLEFDFPELEFVFDVLFVGLRIS
jgi:hypothetical protein